MLLFIYRLIINLIFILSPIIILYRIFKNKEDPKRLKEKFCFFSKKKRGKKLIWFHGASVGEVSSIIPLVLKLEKNREIDQILITSSTLSSSNIIKQFRFKKTIHQFFPIDTNQLSNKFLNYWKPSLAVFIDSEIWPNMILNLKKKSISILLLNARITKKSFQKWKILNNFSRNIFQCIDKTLVSNKETIKHLRYFGVRNIKFFGNLKFIQNKYKNLSLTRDLRKFILRKNSWCSSSTHRGEEIISIKAHKKLKMKYNNLLSVIIPRHVERSQELLEMFKQHNLNVHCHSWKIKIPEKTDIYLVDTYGETEKFFNLITIVFVGGSFINHGGQNPLEPARHGCIVLHGPYVHNFKNIYDYLNKINLAKKVGNEKNLNKNIEILFKNENKSKLVTKRVKKFGDKILTNTIKEIKRSMYK